MKGIKGLIILCAAGKQRDSAKVAREKAAAVFSLLRSRGDFQLDDTIADCPDSDLNAFMNWTPERIGVVEAARDPIVRVVKPSSSDHKAFAFPQTYGDKLVNRAFEHLSFPAFQSVSGESIVMIGRVKSGTRPEN